MDQHRFDAVIRSFANVSSRRKVVRDLVGLSVGHVLGLGLGVIHIPRATEARRTRRHRKKKPKKGKPNAFGCLNVGQPCRRAGQCCSDICEGKRGRKRCRAHDTGGCPPGLHSKNGLEPTQCVTSTGAPGLCDTTTGNAGYCRGGGDCRPCTKDADCQALCGPRAACIALPHECDVGTVCGGPDSVVCPL